MRIRRATAVPAVGVALLVGGLGIGSTAIGASSKTIKVKDDVFSPKSGTIKKGTSIKFVWAGKDSHNVVVTGAASAKSKLQKKGTLVVKASKKGTIKYVCQVHPGMKGTLKVK